MDPVFEYDNYFEAVTVHCVHVSLDEGARARSSSGESVC